MNFLAWILFSTLRLHLLKTHFDLFKPRAGHVKVKVVDEQGFISVTDKPKLFSKDTDITVPVVLKKLSEIQSQRGKKATDRQEQIELIEELRVVAQRSGLGAAMDVRLRIALVSAIFDYNPNVASNMKSDMWKRLLAAISELVAYLNDHGEVEVGDEVEEEEENYDAAAGPLRVHGLPLALVERLDEEFTKVLQGCDAHSPDYVENLKSELAVCSIIERMQVRFSWLIGLFGFSDLESLVDCQLEVDLVFCVLGY